MENARVEDKVSRLIVEHTLGSDAHTDYNKALPTLEEMHQEMMKMYDYLQTLEVAVNQ